MNKQDLLKFLDDYSANGEDYNLQSILEKTDYDELIMIDLKDKKYRVIYHVEHKYFSNLYEGDFEHLQGFILESFIHHDDANDYFSFIDLNTIKERLNNADPKGFLKGFYRIKLIDGSFIRSRHYLVSGKLINGNDDVAFLYVYDDSTRIEKFHRKLANREEITGLYEGITFYKEVRKQIVNLDKNWCFVDILIRNHKLFSDWYGVDRGQYLLTKEAELLKEFAKENGGVVGFMGQEEFCMVCPYDMEKIENLYDAIKYLISQYSSMETFYPAFGVAPFDDADVDIREYYNRAALICELIKGNDGYIKVYDTRIHTQNEKEYKLIYDFEQALKNDEITFNIQPQVKLPDKKIVGGEALARWYKPNGVIYPDDFIPILEKYNLITKLDRYLWEEVCKYLSGLLNEGITPVPISVNVSRIDILSTDIVEYFKDLLLKYDLPKEILHIEITESAYAENSNLIGDTVKKLREEGFMVLMDDFGSGYSSLNMLKSMTVDVIKIDAKFLDISSDNEHKGVNIIESVVNMTRSLNIPIVVEGVETKEQTDYLSNIGCQYIQGFYFYKPMVKDEFTKLLADDNNTENDGFIFKANQQLHIREFMDENIYSDAMLNNIIGPVAFYLWKDDNIDIIRYNEQFFRLVGVGTKDMSERIKGIQNFIIKSDVGTLFSLLEEAKNHHILGSNGVVRAVRPNGEIVSTILKIYFFEERDDGSVFYVSAHDISEIQFDSNGFPGGYYRCSIDNGFTFYYISPNFEKLTGYTSKEIMEKFDNKLVNMVHPDDRVKLAEECKFIDRNTMVDVTPYRLRKKDVGYIYVAEQNKISEMYGVLCFQSVVIDVTESMKLRNQMKILSEYLRDTILMVHRVDGVLMYESVIEDYHLREILGFKHNQLSESLNSGDFCKLIKGYNPDIPHHEYTEKFINQISGKFKTISVDIGNGEYADIMARADRVVNYGDIEYIVFLHVIKDKSSINLETVS